MSRNLIIIIVTTFILVIVGLFVTAFYISRDENVSVGDVLREALPFGEVSEEVVFEENFSDSFLDRVNTPDEIIELPRVRQLTNTPVAGAIILGGTTSSTTARYIERRTGHIYDTPLDTLGNTRVTNTTIPKIYDAYFNETGENVVLRYLSKDFPQIFSGTIESSNTTDEEAGGVLQKSLAGSFLSSGIYALAPSPDNTDIFYLQSNGEVAFGFSYDLKNGNSSQLFRHDFKEWNIAWPEKSTVAFQTKPSGGIDGYLYFFDTNTRSLKKILGQKEGLTTLVSPDTKKVLYTQSDGATMETFIYSVATKESTALAINTIPEKCVWSKKSIDTLYCGIPQSIPPARYPDVWYQGVTSFSDDIWSIDVSTGALDILFNPQDVINNTMDLIDPILSADEEYLVFTNKKDGTLWSLRLNI